jgi:hypothetical protein
MGVDDAACQARDSRDLFRLKFDQVAGLWVILGVAAGVACLMLALLFLGRHVPALRGLTMASLGRGSRRRRGGQRPSRSSFSALPSLKRMAQSFKGAARAPAAASAPPAAEPEGVRSTGQQNA